MKDNQHVQPIVNVESGTVTFKVRGHDDIILHMDRLHPDIIKRAALVGMAQVRIVDAAAVGRADKEGNIIDEEDRLAMKHSRMSALVAHYETGTDQWAQRVAGEGGGVQSLTIRAVARYKQVDYATAEKFVADYLAREQSTEKPRFADMKGALAFLRRSKLVREAMEAIRAESAGSPAIDADEALDELGE